VEVLQPIERTLTHSDHLRLVRLLAQQPPGPGHEAMQDLLDASDVVAGAALPATVVTMGSRVLLQDPAADAPAYQLTLCYPADATPRQGCISVLSPVGASLLGLRVGEIARWRLPDGRAGAARIVAVLFQPETHGEGVA
jgi:regulator of nucleoside diphosphate kinase